MTVPDRFHISWQNDIGQYTIASDVAAESAYPLTNMQNAIANKPTVIDMTSDTAIVMTGSSSTTRTATCFACHNHNLGDDATIRLRLYAGENQTGTKVYDSTATQVPHTIPFGSSIAGVDGAGGHFEDEGNFKPHFSLWFDSVEYKSWQIDFAVPTPTNATVSIDKLWLGFAYCPTYGPEYGAEGILVDPSRHFRKPGGGLDTVEHAAYRAFTCQFRGVKNAERHVLRNILDRAKKGGDLLITFDPNDARSQNYELTSIYRRTTDAGFRSEYYNGNALGLAAEEN